MKIKVILTIIITSFLNINVYANKQFRVLTIDGGGIRGIIPALVLQEIEQRTGKPIHSMFDLIVGTSTGGIIAIALTTPKDGEAMYKAKDLVTLYKERGKEIFDSSWFRKAYTGAGLWSAKYDRTNLDNILNEMLGDAMLSDTLKPIMIISYSLNSNGVLGNGINFWNTRLANTADKRDFYLKDIAGATSAAPTYFNPKEFKNITGDKVFIEADGGLFANNPAIMAVIEAKKINPSLQSKDILVVSIGTGKPRLNKPADDLKRFGVIGWLMRADLIGVMMGASSELTEWQLSILDLNTTRIQIDIDKELGEMDNVTDENINSLIQAANNYINDNEDIIKNLCDILR